MNHNSCLNKVAIIVSNVDYVDMIKKNINSNTIIICVGDSKFFDTPYHITSNTHDNEWDTAFDPAVSLAIYLGCKIIITDSNSHSNIDIQHAFDVYSAHLFSFHELTEEEFIRIINYRHLLVIYFHDNPNYTISGPIRYLIKMFGIYKITTLFLKHGLKVITVDDTFKYLVYRDPFQIIKNLQDNDVLVNLIVMAIHPYGFDKALLYIKPSQQLVLWQDDPHYFANFVEDRIKSGINIID